MLTGHTGKYIHTQMDLPCVTRKKKLKREEESSLKKYNINLHVEKHVLGYKIQTSPTTARNRSHMLSQFRFNLAAHNDLLAHSFY